MVKARKLDMGPPELRALALTLRKISFFSNLSMGDLELVVSATSLYEFPKGRVLFRKGETGNALYLVYQGQVDIFLHRFLGIAWKKLASFGSGEFFGEMALLDQPYRTATAVTATASQLFVLLNVDFNHLLRENAAFANELRRTAARRRLDLG